MSSQGVIMKNDYILSLIVRNQGIYWCGAAKAWRDRGGSSRSSTFQFDEAFQCAGELLECGIRADKTAPMQLQDYTREHKRDQSGGITTFQRREPGDVVFGQGRSRVLPVAGHDRGVPGKERRWEPHALTRLPGAKPSQVPADQAASRPGLLAGGAHQVRWTAKCPKLAARLCFLEGLYEFFESDLARGITEALSRGHRRCGSNDRRRNTCVPWRRRKLRTCWRPAASPASPPDSRGKDRAWLRGRRREPKSASARRSGTRPPASWRHGGRS